MSDDTGWFTANAVTDHHGIGAVDMSAERVGAFRLSADGARALATSLLAAADEAEGKTTRGAHSAAEDAVSKLTEKQRHDLSYSETRGILTDLWPAIEGAFRVQALSDALPVAATSADVGCNDVASFLVCSTCNGEEDVVIGPRKSSMTVPCPDCMPCLFDSAKEHEQARAGVRRLRAEKEGST